MAIAIPMISTNEELLKAANEGDMPHTPNNWTEKDLPAYLLLESGMRNRVISHPVLMMMKRSKSVKTTTRKVYMVV